MLPAKHNTATRIKSFIRRQGRITAGQQYALDKLWTHYVLDNADKADFAKIFGRNAPIYLEIGFGNGASLAEMAGAYPERDFLGIEVHKPGVGHLMRLLERQGLSNVRIFYADALDILEQQISDELLSGLYLFFPDPWPKRRHHKRRIVNAGFLQLITRKLKQGACFHAATDWENYAQAILWHLQQAKGLINTRKNQDSFCQRPDYRPLTKFEQRGLDLGHSVRDIIFRKI